MATNYVEYIRTDGSQWFDTGVSLSSNTKVTMNVRKATQTVTYDAWYIWLGQATTTDTNGGTTGRNIMIRNNNSVSASSIQVCFGGGGATKNVTYSDLNSVGGDFKRIAIETGNFYYGTSSTSITSTAVQNEGNIHLLAGYNSDGGRHIAADIESVIIEKGGVTVAELLPAVYNDVACLFDTVSGQFITANYKSGYTSASNPVVAGPDAGPIPGYPSISVTYSGPTATSLQTEQELTVTYTTDTQTTWHLDTTTPLPQWLTVSPTTGGSGSTTVTLSFAQNTTGTARSHTLSFTDGYRSATASVTQSGVVFYDWIEANTSASSGSYIQLASSIHEDTDKIRISYVRTAKNDGNTTHKLWQFGSSTLYQTNSQYNSSYLYYRLNDTINSIGVRSSWIDNIELRDIELTTSGMTVQGLIYSQTPAFTLVGAFRVLGEKPMNARIGVIELLDSNGERINRYIPCSNEGTLGFWDENAGTVRTTSNLTLSVGNESVPEEKTYKLEAEISESSNINLSGVTIQRIQGGDVTRTFTPQYVSGEYDSMLYRTFDTVDTDECEWDWRAEDIYGNYGIDSVNLSVTGGPDWFWIRNDSLSTDYLAKNLQWSLDGRTWHYESGANITLPPGQKVYLTCEPGFMRNQFYTNITSTVNNYQHSIGGSLSFLLWGLNTGKLTTPSDYVFADFSNGDTGLTDASELRTGRFHVAVPNMFRSAFTGCTSLTGAPDFSGLYMLENNSLYSCFSGCTALATGVYLGNVTYIYSSAMNQMYSGCTSLNKAWTPAVDTYSNDNSQWSNWLVNVAPTGRLYRTGHVNGIPASSASGIPNNWYIVMNDYATLSKIAMSGESGKCSWSIADLGAHDTPVQVRLYAEESDTGIVKEYACEGNAWSGRCYFDGLDFSTGYWLWVEWTSAHGLHYISSKYPVNTSTWSELYVWNVGSSTGTLTVTNNYQDSQSISIYVDGSQAASGSVASGSSTTASVPVDSVARIYISTSVRGNLNITMDTDHIAYGSFTNVWVTSSTPVWNAGSCQGLFQGDTHLVDAHGLTLRPTSGRVIVQINDEGFKNMFAGCTSLERGMYLSDATALGEEALNGMYAGCSNLVEVWLPNVDEWDGAKTDNWLYNVADTGVAHARQGLSVATGASGIPGGWTRENL